MKNRMLTPLRTAGLVVGLGLAGVVAAPSSAQDATEPAATTTAQVDDTETVVEEDEGFDDWGLLGLLGLGGLLRRPARAVVVDPTPTGTRRT